MKDPKSFIATLEGPDYEFALKGSGPLSFHLGCGFVRDSTGTLCMDSGKHVMKMAESYKHIFKSNPPHSNVLMCLHPL